MHYDEERENDKIKNIAQKIKVTLPCYPSLNQHSTITWHFDEMVEKGCADLVKKPKESNE